MAALRAGVIPKMSPIVAATPNDNTMEAKVIMVGISAMLETTEAMEMPNIIPINPPDILIITASKRNCNTISFL